MKEFAAESGIDWDARVQEMQERYQNVKNADPEKELLADLVGEYLFTDSGFVQSLSTKNPSLFKKIFEEIKYLAKTFAGTKQGAALEKVKNTFTEMYRDVDVKNTAQTDGVRYSLNIKHTDGSVEMLADARSLTTEQAVEYLKQAKSGALRRDTYIPVRKDTPQVIIDTLQQVNENVENLSMVMSVDKAQRAMAVSNTGTKTKKYGDNVRKHGLLPEEIVEIINNLDNPNTVIYQTNRFGKDGEQLPNSIAVFVEYNTNGNEGMAAVEFENPRNADAIGTEFGETNYHTVITVFEPDVERKGLPFDYVEELLSNPNNYELEIKRRQLEGSATGEKHPNTSNELPYTISIRNPDEKVNGKFSLSGSKQTEAQPGDYRITGEDIALAPTREDIAEQERIATAPAALRNDTVAQDAPRNDVEELGAPTREDIARMERDKKLKGPLLMKDSLDRELEKLYRLQQTGKIQDDEELSKVYEAYGSVGRDFTEAFNRVVGAYQGDTINGAADGETNAVTKPLSSYPTEKQNAIRSYLQAVDDQIKSFVKRVKGGDLRFERKKVSDVTERAVSDLQKLLGIDVSGYTHNINTSGVQHILRRHGEKGKQDTTMSIDDDIARVGWVLDNYDSVELLTKDGEQVYSSEFKDKNNQPVPQIRFIKKIDGTYYVVEAACENEYQKLWVQSAYLQKNEDVTQVSAEGQETNHKTYAQGELASPSSINSIPEDASGVKYSLGESVAEEIGVPTREDILRTEAEKELHGPWRMTDPLDQKVEKLYRMMLREQVSEEDYIAQLVKADRQYQQRGSKVEAALERVREAYSKETTETPETEKKTKMKIFDGVRRFVCIFTCSKN